MSEQPKVNEQPRQRRASRVILLDPLGRVLLLHGRNWWFTVGGGIDDGETAVEAAIREVREETGIVIAAGDLGPVVLETDHLVPWDDGAWVQQHDEFRIARVVPDAVDGAVISTTGFTALEQATIDEARWWTHDQLRTTTENIAPAGLADLVAGITIGPVA